MRSLFGSSMSLGSRGAFFSLSFFITAFHRISLVVFFISSSLFYRLLVLLHILSTLSGDPPQFITWRVVTSLPLSIPRTLVQRFLVWEGHLVRESFCYLSAWERVYPLLISSLGLILFMFRVCTFVYMCKKKMKRKKNEWNEKKNKHMCVCA